MSDLPTTMPVHIQGLCLTIDEGDDTALPILADALEGIGDPRAAGLRELLDCSPRRFDTRRDNIRWGWSTDNRLVHHRVRGGRVCAAVMTRLFGTRIDGLPYHIATYPTRWDAFLALAAALIAE